MSGSGRINPKTGKRFNWVDPEAEAKAVAEIKGKLALLDREEVIQKARDDLLVFTQFTMPHPEHPNDVKRTRYEAAKFHKAVAEALQGVERGDIPQLIFCVPPRHGKTELATKRLAAWYMGRHPEQNIAVGSYSDTMAEDMGADTRAIMSTPQYRQVFPKFRFRRGGTAKSNFQSDAGGRAVFVGRGGALTGRGAHLLLLDDIFKDHEEARSPTIRDQAWNWFTKVAMTRRMGKKLVIITMTRWHSDDIIGRLTDPENPNYNAEEAANWKIIRLPAVAEEDDPLGREEGEPLWPDGPDKFDLKFFSQQRRLDPLGFAALYQQSPTVADGIMFKRENIKWYDPKDLPEELRYYAASDHAVATGQRNDPSVFLKAGIDKRDDIYLTECFWAKVAADAAVEAMLAMGGGKNRPILWWAERGHISKSIGPFLRKRMQETGTYINIVEVTPTADKSQRAQSIAARIAMQKVYFPRGVAWAEKAVEQLMGFPNGLHDDFVDAIAYIGLGLQSQFGPSRSVRKVVEQPKTGSVSWLKQMDKWNAENKRSLAAGGF